MKKYLLASSISLLVLTSFKKEGNNNRYEDPKINKLNNTYNKVQRTEQSRMVSLVNNFSASYSDIDAQVDLIIPPNRIYTKYEALQIRDYLQSQLKANPGSLVYNWALVRFYALSPVYAGGSIGLALQQSSYIYSLNSYLGCLAYEYVYSRNGYYDKAQRWYKKSLINPLPRNMVWEEISYHKTPQQNVKVVGQFNNWKSQYLYEDLYGIYKRRVMKSKADASPYKLIVDYKNFDAPSKSEFIVSVF